MILLLGLLIVHVAAVAWFLHVAKVDELRSRIPALRQPSVAVFLALKLEIEADDEKSLRRRDDVERCLRDIVNSTYERFVLHIVTADSDTTGAVAQVLLSLNATGNLKAIGTSHLEPLSISSARGAVNLTVTEFPAPKFDSITTAPTGTRKVRQLLHLLNLLLPVGAAEDFVHTAEAPEVLVLIDHDTRPCAAWLERLVQPFTGIDRAPSPAVVSGNRWFLSASLPAAVVCSVWGALATVVMRIARIPCAGGTAAIDLKACTASGRSMPDRLRDAWSQAAVDDVVLAEVAADFPGGLWLNTQILVPQGLQYLPSPHGCAKHAQDGVFAQLKFMRRQFVWARTGAGTWRILGIYSWLSVIAVATTIAQFAHHPLQLAGYLAAYALANAGLFGVLERRALQILRSDGYACMASERSVGLVPLLAGLLAIQVIVPLLVACALWPLVTWAGVRYRVDARQRTVTELPASLSWLGRVSAACPWLRRAGR